MIGLSEIMIHSLHEVDKRHSKLMTMTIEWLILNETYIPESILCLKVLVVNNATNYSKLYCDISLTLIRLFHGMLI